MVFLDFGIFIKVLTNLGVYLRAGVVFQWPGKRIQSIVIWHTCVIPYSLVDWVTQKRIQKKTVFT